jgi:hypothetical protein
MGFILQSYSPVVDPPHWSSDIGFDDLKCFDDISSDVPKKMKIRITLSGIS